MPTQPRSTRRSASQRIREAETVVVERPLVGHLRIPHPERLAFYGGLAGMAALQLVEWPLALVFAAAHTLSENHHSRVAQELGEALDEA
jgi:hypothetical protein